MLIRDRMIDLGVLYSLKRDLERFWQYKHFKWENLLRHQEVIAKTRAPVYTEEPNDTEKNPYALIEAQEGYIFLRQRILEQRKQALDIVHFFGISSPKHLTTLDFAQPLPDNQEIEATINEVDVLAHYVSHLNYPMQTVRYLLRITYQWLYSLVGQR